MYAATKTCFGEFLSAALLTGPRTSYELAKSTAITADDVTESERGTMRRVYSSKTRLARFRYERKWPV